MRVKVDGVIHDSAEKPIVIVLSEDEKQLIANMKPDEHRYCSFPQDCSIDEIKKYMTFI